MKKRWWVWILGIVFVMSLGYGLRWLLYTDHEARFKKTLWPVLPGYLDQAGIALTAMEPLDAGT